LIPFLSFSQNDFETRYYVINAESLPEPPSIPSILDEIPKKKGSFTLGDAPTYLNVRNANSINTTNYWQPVDIASAMQSNTISYSNKQFNVSRLQQKQFGFSVTGNGGSTNFEFSDGETRVTNQVYQQQLSPLVLDPYQPYFRRNPYRTNRTPFNTIRN
jgi:hypothetical protein